MFGRVVLVIVVVGMASTVSSMWANNCTNANCDGRLCPFRKNKFYNFCLFTFLFAPYALDLPAL
jgi:hypothetical protein